VLSALEARISDWDSEPRYSRRSSIGPMSNSNRADGSDRVRQGSRLQPLSSFGTEPPAAP
jgi:hypothetical protein